MRNLNPLPVGALLLAVLAMACAVLEMGVDFVLASGLAAVVFAVLAGGDDA